MKRALLSLAMVALVACAAASGFMKGDTNSIISGVTESTGTVVNLTQDLSKCEQIAAAEITFDEERTIGGTVALNWVQQGGGLLVDVSTADAAALASPKTLVVQDTPHNRLHTYVNVVGKNLAARSTRPTLQWTFGVLDTEVVNAVSAPGGYVFVTRGLLKRVNNEAALAGILSHEIAHVTRKDAFAIYQKTKVDQCKSLAYAKAGQKEGSSVLRSYSPGFINQAYSALQSFSGGALDLNSAANNALLTLFSDEFVHRYLEGGYARDQELGADATGLEITVASGYSPRGFVDFIGALPSGQNFFAHHPPPSDRVAAMKLMLGKTRMASATTTSGPGTPFSPFNQDLSQLPLVPLHDELAAAR
jgi:Zn-dependent protease with chaperone function